MARTSRRTQVGPADEVVPAPDTAPAVRSRRRAAAGARARSRLADAKVVLMAEAAAVAAGAHFVADVDPPLLLGVYYRHVAAEDIVGRDPVDILGAAASHLQLAAHRPTGRAAVRVLTATVEEQGWASGHTVVEVITDDMPFLVDSIMAELSRQDRAIHLVVHPQVLVRRDLRGELLEVLDDDAGAPGPADASLEAWVHVEIDRETELEDVEQITAQLRRVLSDVREAVEDWAKMRNRALDLAGELEAQPPTARSADDVAEGVALLRWLAADHFTFLGARSYELLTDDDGTEVLRPVPASGLGILRSDRLVSNSFALLPPDARAHAHEPSLLVLTKANSRATVHRPAYLDYVGIKNFDEAGRVVGERRFLGLFAAAAYTQSVRDIPVVRRTVEQVLEASGFPERSHSARDLLQLLETYPRDELFEIDAATLAPIALSIVHLQERRQVRLFSRRDAFGRFMSCLVYLPRDRYTTAVREKMMAILKAAYAGETVDYSALVSESVLARLHFVVRMPRGSEVPDVDTDELEERLAAATRDWVDDFARAVLEQCGEEGSARLLRRYGPAFPEGYKEVFPARTAVADLRHLEALASDEPSLNLYEPYGAASGQRRLKVYRVDRPLSLSEVLPHLQRMGVEVVDERPYEIERRGASAAYVYDFGLRWDAGTATPDNVKELFQDALSAVWRGDTESDGFNALVVKGGLTWRQVVVLRAYARYLRQCGLPFSQDYVESCLVGNLRIARLLVRLFEARLSPALDGDGDGRAEVVDGLVEELHGCLDAVESLDQDRILRALAGAIRATLRTNYYQHAPDGRPKRYVSIKLSSAEVPELPAPRPKVEIWVHSPQVEGVHLRFGAVARGGLRWSDRREDFRTEVLGLVKAQMVKNAVIVPVGAKGGFVVRRPAADPADREAVTAEGVECYREFIRGLLDVTDNLVGGRTVPPRDVVRHDGDDAYLVVAADKGTAAFSDIANALAAEYGFWLGDAFASGGSVGYDHKTMGITARGAWESVKRHFRSLDIDVSRQTITAVGIGDMSGDVFGNGMLLSRALALVAAFDHRHIFLDPSPEPERAFAERQRLFGLPRSSWADYDRAVISAGGGVYPRTAKSVPVSPQVAEVLAIPTGTTSLPPQQLIRYILTAQVGLFWNGGIGTYVKAAAETNAAVGDKANDAIRVDGSQLRAAVVGEGGNLGFTQLGRVEYARRGGPAGAGGLINTDAIDNSAGVDTSDHEVNLKILFDRLVADGDLTVKQRNDMLASMTDDVAALVLADNYRQNALLTNSRRQSTAMLPVARRFIRDLEAKGVLDRGLEFLPDETALEARAAEGRGLTTPEDSVLLAYSKINLTDRLVRTDLADEPWFARALEGYFPPLVRARFGDRLSEHPLRQEIIVTCVVNDMVNRGGYTFAFRAEEETGAGPAEIARAYTAVREIFGLRDYWAQVASLDDVAPTAAQANLYFEARRLLDRGVRWFLHARRSQLEVGAEIARFQEPVSELTPLIPGYLVGVERERLDRRAKEIEVLGAPAGLAMRSAALLDAFSLLDIVEIASARGVPANEVGPLYFALSERMQVDRLLMLITSLPRGDRWQSLARSALRYDLYSALAALTVDVLHAAAELPSAGVEERIEAWAVLNGEGLARARATLDEVAAAETADLATLSVALRVVRTLQRAGTGGGAA